MGTYNILGVEFTTSEEMDAFNHDYVEFEKLALKAQEDYLSAYATFTRVEDFLDRGTSAFKKAIRPSLQQAVKILMDHGILTCDTDRFWEKNRKTLDQFSPERIEVLREYSQIEEKLEAEKEYRAERKQNRGRWEGGGFGLDGAIKGAAQAGAMNMASGAAHSVANGLGNLVSSAEAASRKRNLFDDDLQYRTAQAVYQSVQLIPFQLMNILLEEAQIVNDWYAYMYDPSGAEAIRKNAIEIIQEPEDKREAMVKSLIMDPYRLKWYDDAIRNFGDQGKHIEQFATEFGMNERDQINRIKRSAIEEKEAALYYHSEAEAEAAKSELLGYLEYYGLDSSEKLQQINDYLEEYDVSARTVEKILYDTREQATEAREELKIIRAIIKQTDETDLIDLAVEIVRLRPFQTKTGLAYMERARKLFEKMDLQKRTVDGIVFDNRDTAAAELEDYNSIKQLLSKMDVSDIDSIEQTHAAIDTFSSVIGKKYQAEIAERHAALELELRKVDTILPEMPNLEYPSAREAKPARELVGNLAPVLKNLVTDDADSYRRVLDCLDGLQLPTQIIDAYRAFLEPVEKELSLKERLRFGRYFETKELALRAVDVYIKAQKLLNSGSNHTPEEWEACSVEVVSAGLPDDMQTTLLNAIQEKTQTRSGIFRKLGKTLQQAVGAMEYCANCAAKLGMLDRQKDTQGRRICRICAALLEKQASEREQIVQSGFCCAECGEILPANVGQQIPNTGRKLCDACWEKKAAQAAEEPPQSEQSADPGLTEI